MQQTVTESARAQLRRQLTAYFLATFIISWGIFGAVMMLGFNDSPVVILGIWGPSLSAIFVTAAFYGKDGLKRFFSRIQFKTGLTWCLPMLGVFLAIGFSGRFIGSLAAGIEFDPRFWGWAWAAQVLITQLIIPGLGEEFGWRGFALQRLQHLMSPLRATLALAFVHLLWHMPTYWLGQGMHNVPLIWAATFVVPWTILFTWAYNKSQGSILVSVLFHATMGATLSYTAFLPSDRVIPVSPDLITMTWLPDGLMGPYIGVVCLYWILALYVLRGGFGGLGTPPEFEHPVS